MSWLSDVVDAYKKEESLNFELSGLKDYLRTRIIGAIGRPYFKFEVQLDVSSNRYRLERSQFLPELIIKRIEIDKNDSSYLEFNLDPEEQIRIIKELIALASSF